jgi:hypothetical protein
MRVGTWTGGRIKMASATRTTAPMITALDGRRPPNGAGVFWITGVLGGCSITGDSLLSEDISGCGGRSGVEQSAIRGSF